jgi:predicted metal-dependent phosphoesterase TrpH
VAVLAIALLLPPRAVALRVPAGDGRLVRGSLHVHTSRSDGAGTIDDVAQAAHDAGLDFVVTTDHGDATRVPDPPAYRSGVLCIDAVEISTTGGHYVALGLGAAPYRLAGEPRDVVEDVTRLGGFGIAAHPASPKPELRWDAWDAGIDGVEWLNADSEWRDEPPGALLRGFTSYWFRAPETIAALFDREDSVFVAWDRLSRRRPVVAVAGHDAHARVGLAGNWEPDQGDVALKLPGYENAFRAFGVRALLAVPFTRNAAADAERLLSAVRAGHVFTVVDAMAGPAVLEFAATGEAGRAAMGDVLDETGPVRLAASVTPAPGVRLALVKDGTVVARTDGPELRFEHPGGLARSVYRIEASLGGPAAGRLPWIVGNPIYVGPPPDDLVSRSVAVAGAEGLTMVPQPTDWRIEREARSRGTLSALEGRTLRFDWTLGGGFPSGQFAAAVRPLPHGRVQDWHQVAFTAVAGRPMRLSVQLRTRGGERWIRSVFVDTSPRAIAVRFDDLHPAERSSAAAPHLADVDALLVVVDTVNTVPGTAGSVRLTDARLERLAR